jgi:hypothetical protein
MTLSLLLRNVRGALVQAAPLSSGVHATATHAAAVVRSACERHWLGEHRHELQLAGVDAWPADEQQHAEPSSQSSAPSTLASLFGHIWFAVPKSKVSCIHT